MLRTPLKNSKNVNKPFKSPFDSSAQNKDQSKISNKNLKEDSKIVQSPVSTRNFEAKRALLLEDNERDRKRLKTSTFNRENALVIPSENATKSDLFTLKRKIFEIRQELDCLKSRIRCTKKHNTKELQFCIDKWTITCRKALEILTADVRERNGENSKISDVLDNLGIPESVVRYSKKDDEFV